MKHGIPTTYHNIQFRSRAEARWAALFDLLGWEWRYEELDLHYYIPDFIINQCLLAEVKGDAYSIEKLQPYVAKIQCSGWDKPWVLLGTSWKIQLGTQLELPENAEALWAEACNRTQWKSPCKAPRITKQDVGFDLSLFHKPKAFSGRQIAEQTFALPEIVRPPEPAKSPVTQVTRLQLPGF